MIPTSEDTYQTHFIGKFLNSFQHVSIYWILLLQAIRVRTRHSRLKLIDLALLLYFNIKKYFNCIRLIFTWQLSLSAAIYRSSPISGFTRFTTPEKRRQAVWHGWLISFTSGVMWSYKTNERLFPLLPVKQADFVSLLFLFFNEPLLTLIIRSVS